MTEPRRVTCLLACLVLASCSPATPYDRWNFGAVAPDAGFDKTDETWHAWAEVAWRKACAAIQVKHVRGAVQRQGRECRVGEVSGYWPVTAMAAISALKGSKGRLYDVG